MLNDLLYMDQLRGTTTLCWNGDISADVGFVGEDGRHRCFVNDCQGNMRAVVKENGFLEEVDNYYPYGMPMLTEVVSGMYNQPYKYGGKELERQYGLNQYDFGARWYDPARPGTTTMDPLCERRPWESPYLWCGGNPVRYVDPTGLFSLENIDKNSHYPLIVVFPQQFVTDRVLKMDYEASHNAKIPMMLVENVADFADAMSSLSNDLNSETGAYAINSHGTNGSFSIGTDKISLKKTKYYKESDLTVLKQGLNRKKVFIEACNVASDGGEKLIEKFSLQTNSTVIAPTHPILAGYKYDGSNGLTRHPIVNSIVGLFGKNYSNEYKMSVKGAPAVSIFNLSIEKDAGFSWDKGNNSIIGRLFE